MLSHSLRSKMLSVYAILILLLLGISTSFILNLLSLGRSIDNLMEANYKSIVAAQNMIEALDSGQMAVFNYAIDGSPGRLEDFESSYKGFTEAYMRADINITESGEGEIVKNIDTYYKQYYRSVLDIQAYKKSHSVSDTLRYFDDTVSKFYDDTKGSCNQLLSVNEKAMFERKNRAIENADVSVWISILITAAVVIAGLVLLLYVMSKIFVPIRKLTDSVKSIKEGDLYHEIGVKSDDEIGELAGEFNNMTARLQHYEQINIEKLISEKSKSLAIVNSISDPIIVTDNDFNIILINPMSEYIFDTKQEDAVNKHILETIDYRLIFNLISDVINGKGKNSIDNQNMMTLEVDGNEKCYDIIVAPILGKSNKINGAVTILRDITHLKEVEKLKSNFVSTVSHEFRTPLTSISMGVGLLLDGTLGTIDENQREIISVIKEEGQRLTALVNDLLDLSKIESGKISINMKPSSIEAIIQSTIKTLMEQANSKQIELASYIDSMLPLVKADPEKIKLVLTNLIGNAIKFTPREGKIEVHAHQRDNKVYVSVKDNGIGIPKEYHESIFSEFVQLKQGNEDYIGTGLGLTITRKMVEMHGGDIWVESEPGRGSTFTFTLKTM